MQELSRSIIVHRIVFVFLACFFLIFRANLIYPSFFLCPLRITWVSWVLLFCWNWKSLMEKNFRWTGIDFQNWHKFKFHVSYMKVLQQYDHTCVARWSIFRLNNSLPKSIIYTSSILIWLAMTCTWRTKIHQI